MRQLRRILDIGALWLGLIGFILVMGVFIGVARYGLGDRVLDDIGPLIAGAVFVGTMVLLFLGFARLIGWIGRLFRRV